MVATRSSPSPVRTRSRRPPKRSRRGLWLGLGALSIALAAVVGVWMFSGVRLAPDDAALGRVELQRFAGSLVSVRARASNGAAIPLVVSHGLLTPRVPVASGERIRITVVVRRPGWEGWALGAQRRETLTVKTPVARVLNRWVTAARGTRAKVRFDTQVHRVSVAGAAIAGKTVTLPTKTAAGSVAVAAAARTWERVGAPVRVT